ncbi:MAG: tetratricopeptide repeat protein, partial [Anaerolineaceae bacterium]
MSKIALRSYNREIENMIDRGDSLEAVAHCKHILTTFPKHIDTYRLLGKALLESQKYGDAADIFQRVLSSVPDDFISHIGMSIVREDEGNLDASIWHMERAFEIQPSNSAVQDELKRLYGRRDGIEPSKNRLTRGALVRMYTRGELYQQAIAEIRAALSEDPLRIDLEVILARLYFLTDRKVEATEICSKLISKLPYCYEANRILADILPDTTRAEDAKIFRQRIHELDPYFSESTITQQDIIEVPDNAVTLDY